MRVHQNRKWKKTKETLFELAIVVYTVVKIALARLVVYQIDVSVLRRRCRVGMKKTKRKEKREKRKNKENATVSVKAN